MTSQDGRIRRILDRLDGDLSRAHGSAYALESGLSALLQIAGAEAGLGLVLASEQADGVLSVTEGLEDDVAQAWMATLRHSLETDEEFPASSDLVLASQSQGYAYLQPIPFAVSGWVMGGALILCREPLSLTAAQQRWIGKAQDKISAVLERTRMLEELQARVLEWSLLMRLGQEIVSLPDSSLLPRAVSLVASTFGYEQVAFLRHDGEGWLVEALAGRALDGWKTGERVVSPNGLLARAPSRESDEAAWASSFAEARTEKTRGWSSAEVMVPVRLGREMLGVLDVRASDADAFTQRDAGVMKSVADQLAVALQNQRLLLQEQRRVAYLESVARIGQEIAAILRLQDLLRQVVDSVGRHLGYEAVYLFLLDEAEVVATMVSGYCQGVPRHYDNPEVRLRVREEGLVGRAVRTGRAVLVNDVSSDPSFVPDSEFPTASELCISLTIGNRVIGVLDIGSTRANAFSDEDARVLAILSNLIAVGIENARLYERERLTAGELAERNLALVRAQARLVGAERLAAIGQLGLAVKHELNNPLTAILGNTEWLLEQEADLSEDGRGALRMVHSMSLRVRDIVARLGSVEDVRRPYLGSEMIDLTNRGKGEAAK
jgi:GAF domain-containing protein